MIGTVGVIMPAFNSAAWIADSIASLQAQITPGWICVVVDDGSTDSTPAIVDEIATRDARIVLVRQAQVGVAAARNLGLRHLPDNCSDVLLLDSDDLLVPDAIAVLSERLAQRPDAVGVFGLAEYIDEAGNEVDHGRHPSIQRARRTQRRFGFAPLPPGSDSTFADVALYGPIWPSAVGLHRRAAIDAVGGFNPTVRLMSDWDLYLKMSRLGPFAMVDRQVAWYRRHDTNLTSDPVANSAAQTGVVFRAWHDATNTPDQRKLIGRGWWLIRAHETVALGRTVLWAIKRRELHLAVRTTAAFLVQAYTLTRVRPQPPARLTVASLLSKATDAPGRRESHRLMANSRATNPAPNGPAPSQPSPETAPATAPR